MQEIVFAPKSPTLGDIRGISILDSRVLTFEGIDGLDFTGISDLAFDGKSSLYALSDQGHVFELYFVLANKRIETLSLRNAFRLKDKKAQVLSKSKRDAEGMDFLDGHLVISFERKPKVSMFDLNGVKLKNFEIPSVLRDINNYQGKNSALESVVMHPEFGMITAPQRPLKHGDENKHTLFSHKKRCSFKADADITAIETMSDGSLLVLEREFRLFGLGRTIWLKKVPIVECEGTLCPVEILARLNSSDGWTLDNFEGLTRVGKKSYLMISDDNGSFLQKCILVLFEVE